MAGSAAVDEEVLRRRLGATTYLVWRALCDQGLRDPRTGECRLTTPQVSRAVGVGVEMVRDAFARLRRAGLIDCERWLRVAKPGASVRFIRVRRLRGAPPVATGLLMAVPEATAAFAASPGRGGARAGSGGSRPGAGRKRISKAPQVNHQSAPGVGEKNQQSTPGFLSSPSLALCTNTYGTAAPAGTAGLIVTERAPMNRTAKLDPAKQAELEAAAADRPSILGSFNDRVRGAAFARGPHPSTVATRHAIVPPELWNPYPIRVPEPPKLDPRDDELRHAQLLANWYSGAVESRTGKRCFVFMKGAARSKFLPVLKSIAQVLLENDIAPAAWIAFSIDVWRRHNPEGMPPIKWVFSASRIEERAEWFASELNDYSGGKIIFTDALRSFITDQQRMRGEINRAFPDTETELRALVAKYFPAGAYDRRKRELEKEALEYNDDLKARVASGSWVW